MGVRTRARHRVDSLLHPRRRRSAQRRLTNARPRSVLFVCQGNICRSPFAAALFAQLLPPTFSVSVASGGFVGPGRAPPGHALTTARTYGVDLSGHRSSALTSTTQLDADLIVVMSRAQEEALAARKKAGSMILVLGDLDPQPITQRTILDPWDSPVTAFDESYQRIDRCVRELARIVWGVE